MISIFKQDYLVTISGYQINNYVHSNKSPVIQKDSLDLVVYLLLQKVGPSISFCRDPFTSIYNDTKL